MVREFLRCCCGLAVTFNMRYPISRQCVMLAYHRLRAILYSDEIVLSSGCLPAPHCCMCVYVYSLSSRQISIILDYCQNALPDKTAWLIQTVLLCIRLNKSHGYKTSSLKVTHNKYLRTVIIQNIWKKKLIFFLINNK